MTKKTRWLLLPSLSAHRPWCHCGKREGLQRSLCRQAWRSPVKTSRRIAHRQNRETYSCAIHAPGFRSISSLLDSRARCCYPDAVVVFPVRFFVQVLCKCQAVLCASLTLLDTKHRAKSLFMNCPDGGIGRHKGLKILSHYLKINHLRRFVHFLCNRRQ